MDTELSVDIAVSTVSAVTLPTDSKPTAIAAKIDLHIVFLIFSPIIKICNILHTYNDIFSYLYQKHNSDSVALATS